MEFSRQEYWSGLPFPSPGDFPDPWIEPESPGLQADCSPYEPSGEPNRYWRYLIKFNCPSSLKKNMNSWIKYSHLSPKASTMPFSGNLEGFSKQEHEKNDCNDLLFNINLQFMSRGSSGLSELPRCPLCPWSLPSPQAGTIHIYSFLSLIILPSPSHSSPRITSWFAETEASGLSETSFHPCLRLLCPPTTDKHWRCIKSQALSSPHQTWFQQSFPSPTSSVFLLLLGHPINQMPLFHLKNTNKQTNLTLLLLTASIPLLCSCYSKTPHSSRVRLHPTKTAPVDSQWPPRWQTKFLSWLLTRPVSITDTSDPFPLTHLHLLAFNWPVTTRFHFPPWFLFWALSIGMPHPFFGPLFFSLSLVQSRSFKHHLVCWRLPSFYLQWRLPSIPNLYSQLLSWCFSLASNSHLKPSHSILQLQPLHPNLSYLQSLLPQIMDYVFLQLFRP